MRFTFEIRWTFNDTFSCFNALRSYFFFSRFICSILWTHDDTPFSQCHFICIVHTFHALSRIPIKVNVDFASPLFELGSNESSVFIFDENLHTRSYVEVGSKTISTKVLHVYIGDELVFDEFVMIFCFSILFGVFFFVLVRCYKTHIFNLSQFHHVKWVVFFLYWNSHYEFCWKL